MLFWRWLGVPRHRVEPEGHHGFLDAGFSLAVHHFWKTRMVSDLGYWQIGIDQRLVGTTGREQTHAALVQSCC